PRMAGVGHHSARQLEATQWPRQIHFQKAGRAAGRARRGPASTQAGICLALEALDPQPAQGGYDARAAGAEVAAARLFPPPGAGALAGRALPRAARPLRAAVAVARFRALAPELSRARKPGRGRPSWRWLWAKMRRGTSAAE